MAKKPDAPGDAAAPVPLPAAPQQNPSAGGCYTTDPVTGALTPAPKEEPAK
jgi:hypothetical protein